MKFKPSPTQWLYALKIIIFTSLLIACYFLYMRAALSDYLKGSVIIVTRSEDMEQFEAPVITICPNHDFKPTVNSKYQFYFPTRYLFTGKLSRFLANDPETLAKIYDVFDNTTVEEVFKTFSYAYDITFVADSISLNEVQWWSTEILRQ